MNLGEFAADLGFYGNGGIGLHVADDLDFDGHVLLGGYRYGDGDVAASTPTAAFLAAATTAGIGGIRGGDADAGAAGKGSEQDKTDKL